MIEPGDVICGKGMSNWFISKLDKDMFEDWALVDRKGILAEANVLQSYENLRTNLRYTIIKATPRNVISLLLNLDI